MKNKTVLLQEQLIIFSSIEEMKLDDIQKELGEFDSVLGRDGVKNSAKKTRRTAK